MSHICDTSRVCVIRVLVECLFTEREGEREREHMLPREHILLHLEALVKIILVSIGRRGQLGELALTLFDLQRRQEFERVCERLT